MLLCVPAAFMTFYFVKKYREKRKLEKEILERQLAANGFNPNLGNSVMPEQISGMHM
jgi:hypothetical protein